MTAPALERDVDIDLLRPHPSNPRKGNIPAIRQSIREHGFVGLVAAQLSSQRILVGRHRWEAAKEEGYTKLDVHWLDISDEQALRLLLADNRSSDLASYDDDQLLRNLRDIGNLQGTLFDLDAIETLEAKVGQVATIDAEFKGDYADAGAEMEQRAAAAERVAQEFKDVVLVMRPEDYATFMADVKTLQKRWGISGLIATVVSGVHRLATDQTEQAVEKVERMRKWRDKVEWMIPHEERVGFLEDFS